MEWKKTTWRIVKRCYTLFSWEQPLKVGNAEVWKRPWEGEDGFGEHWSEATIANLVGGMYEMLDGIVCFSSAGFIRTSFSYDFVLRRCEDSFKRKARAEARKKQQVIIPCLRGRAI